MSEVKNLNPQIVWKNFHALTQIPHPSGYYEKMQEFLLDWAKQHNIEAYKDDGENIVMRKPATSGMENKQTVVLQAHMDMVPQAVVGNAHCFETDPIQAFVDGDWVRAKGTTLGADDGIGVASIMAVFEDDTLQHGPLEALITVDEETCMYGVNHLSADTLKGNILLNIDNETLGEFVIGSAGGVNIAGRLGYKEVQVDPEDIALRITIKDLRGGHSGLVIAESRANANKLMARLVRQAIVDDEARLASWNGGNMYNSIPRECEVVVTIPAENEADLMNLVDYCRQLFINEYAGVEEGLTLQAERVDLPKGQVPEEIQDNLVSAILACHDGVLRNIPSMPHVVETSSNLAIVKIGDGMAEIFILARSSNDGMLEYEGTMIESCLGMAGMKIEFSGEYGAWQPNFSSPIAAKMIEVYRDLFGEEAKTKVIHAGLECSMIGNIYPSMDMVSFGPTIRCPHTPDECCNIPSVARFWEFLKALLSQVPDKK